MVLFNHTSSLKPPGTTHFYMDIDCYVNPGCPITFFGTQNESRHFDWCDSSMSLATPIGVTHFWVKTSLSLFESFSIFL
jgi:hypothetical protein